MRRISLLLATVSVISTMANTTIAHEHGHSHDEDKHQKMEVENHDHSKTHTNNELLIKKLWIRSTAPGAPTTAAYFILMNNTTEDITLTGVKSDIAERVEIHEHSMTDGVMKMQKVNGVIVAKQSSVTFKPGGYHIMFIGLKDSVNEGDNVSLTLVFDNNTQQTIKAIAKKKAGEDKHHHHKHH